MAAVEPAIGLVYRPQFRVELFNAPAEVDYLEITAEQYFDLRGRTRDDLDALRSTFPIVVHALGLSIGSAEGIERRYLDQLARLLDFVRAPWWSDHLPFTRAGGRNAGHFIPLRRDDASVQIVARNAETVRRTIATPFALENTASPFIIPGGTYDEAEFLIATARAARCRLLLDVENLHANERNFGESGDAVVDAIPPELIAEIHFAGGKMHGDFYVDSHDAPVPERTWLLLERVRARNAALAITLERDGDLRDLWTLRPELDRGRQPLLAAPPA